MTKPNIIDRAVAVVAPVHAAKRAAARAALSVINSGYGNYGANTTKKSMRGWEYYGGSAKEDIEDNIDILRQRSRDAYMGIPAASAALKTMRTNVIAGGLLPSPQIDAEFLGMTDEAAEELQTQIVREFSLWANKPICDAERIDNFYQLQQLTFLSYLMNGDAIVLLPMRQVPWQPYDLRIRLIEADRVCSPDGYDRLMPCEVRGNSVYQIVQGVETDKDGMVVAFWICSKHPLASTANIEPGGQDWVRVEAYGEETGRRNVLHVMNRERAGQRRGVPILAPVLEALKQLGRYTDAEITAAVLSAMFTVFVKSENPSDARPFGELLPPEDGKISQKTEDIVGPYTLHDFYLYHLMRFGYRPAKIYRLAQVAFAGEYDNETILKWLVIFYRRFFNQQFKRSCLPDGPKVGSVAVSPRGDLRMPSDASWQLWEEELNMLQ